MNSFEFTDTEKFVVKKALDFYARILCGQINELESLYRHGYLVPPDIKKSAEIIKKLHEIKRLIWPDLPKHGYYGITDGNIPDNARIAYRLVCMLDNKESPF